VPEIDAVVQQNAAYAAGYEGPPARPPARALAVVACMDARLDLLPALGLEVGDAHILRNAGGLPTEDVLRSLTISQLRPRLHRRLRRGPRVDPHRAAVPMDTAPRRRARLRLRHRTRAAGRGELTGRFRSPSTAHSLETSEHCTGS
jgi:hypothetical protein